MMSLIVYRRLTDDAERLQLLQRTQPGREATLDALPDVPVADRQRPEWRQAPQGVLWQDGFWVIHQLQGGESRAAVPGRSYRTEFRKLDDIMWRVVLEVDRRHWYQQFLQQRGN